MEKFMKKATKEVGKIEDKMAMHEKDMKNAGAEVKQKVKDVAEDISRNVKKMNKDIKKTVKR